MNNTVKQLLWLIPLLLFAIPRASATPTPDADAAIVAGKAALPGLTLTLTVDKAQYEQGEPIPVTLHYTYSGTRPLSVEVVTYDRSGRIMDFGFTATDVQGKPILDPTPFQGGAGGGLSTETSLAPGKPFQQTVTLNEWLRFDAPGSYTVTAYSTIVHFNDDGTGLFGNPSLPLDSAPLRLTITPPDEAHRQARLARDEAGASSKNIKTRRAALRDLRFMVDARAIPTLVRGLDQGDANAAFEAWYGLRTFADLAPVKVALLRSINAPSHLILPSRQGPYLDLLTEADQRAQGKPEVPFGDDFSKPYETLFAAHLRRAMAALPPARAAEITVEAMALGEILPLNNTENWRRIFENAHAMSLDSQAYAGSLLDDPDFLRSANFQRSVLRPLIPQMRRVAADPRLAGDLRSGTILALHSLGDDSQRNRLVEDLLSATPVFNDDAHAILGHYQARKIGRGLLRLAMSPDADTRVDAARRLPSFGGQIPAAKLRALLVRDAGDGYDVRDNILEALAMKSPQDALPIIARDVRSPKRLDSGMSDMPINLLCRIDSPDARRLTEELFRSANPRSRQILAQALNQSAQEAAGRASTVGLFQMPPNGPLAASYFPELLALTRNDSDGQVRASARQALTTISGIPKGGSYGTTEQQRAWVPLWQVWWQQHRALHR